MMETRPRIMVVDDEERICRSVEKILKKNNYEVTCATSASEAMEKMALESYSLLISDIVMPNTNGLELLKLVKKEWPLTKVMMITAYASTDTAMKAIRLGALDYLPKPFTPDELRQKVNLALSGELTEAPSTEAEREHIDIIDVDIPFDQKEVAKAAGDEYAKMLGRSDMPVVEVRMPEPLAGFCDVGNMVCDIFKKLGMTCKAGTKTAECPQLKAKKRMPATAKIQGFDGKTLIAPDMPFSFEEVAAVTGPEYLNHLIYEGVAVTPYEQLKENMKMLLARESETRPDQQAVQAVAREKHILVVDDEVAVNNNIRKILDKKGLPVDQAFTKAEALEKIKKGFYELVLLDLKIPGVKGLELLEAVRHYMPDSRVIIVTGYASIETAVESARLGAVNYLAKPFTPDEIRNMTENALRLAA